MVVADRAPGGGIIWRMARTNAWHERGAAMRAAIVRELARRERERLPAPTWAELAAAVGSTATNVRHHCARLAADGVVVYDHSRARTLRLVTPKS